MLETNMFLNEMLMFYWVVNQGSFSRAAQRLGLSKSYVSKRISALEQHYQLKLLQRSTREISMTSAGQHFFQICEKVVRQSHEANVLLHQLHAKPSGSFRISAPPAIGQYVLPELINKFMVLYPSMRIIVELESKMTAVIAGEYDLVLRYGRLKSSNLICRHLVKLSEHWYASPAYIQNYGLPRTVSDLRQHRLACYSRESRLVKLGLKTICESNQLEFIKGLAIQGQCLALLPDLMCEREWVSAELLRVERLIPASSSALYAVYPERQWVTPALREFLKCLMAWRWIGS